MSLLGPATPKGEEQPMSLRMGELIFILSDQDQTVVPAIVEEEHVQRKLGGEQISWKVRIGPRGRHKIVDTRVLKGTIYTSLEAVRTALLDRVYGYMDEMFMELAKNTKEWYQIETSIPTLLHGGGEVDGEGSTILEKSVDPASLITGFDQPPGPPPPPSPATPSLLREGPMSPTNGGRTLNRAELKNVLLKEILDEGDGR